MNQYREKVEIISRLLRERAAVFPVRDASYEKLSSELQKFAGDFLSEMDFENYPYDAGLIERAMKISDSPVFICGPMKSGTTLLCQLLDSHPDLLAMPGDSHFVNQFDRWHRGQFHEIASYWVHRIVNPTGQEPFWFLGQEEETFRKFLAYLRYFLENTELEIFICVVMAFHVAQERRAAPAPGRYWVEKTPHNELHAQRLGRMFPKAKFIHILRDPLNNIASLKKLDQYHDRAVPAGVYARVFRKLFRSARKNLTSLGRARYLVLRYEELTHNPVDAMNRVCGFLEIPFHASLLTPTENGMPAVANSMYREDRVKGTILKRDQDERRWREYEKGELQDVVTTLYSEALMAGYAWDAAEISQYRKTGLAYLRHLVADGFESLLERFR